MQLTATPFPGAGTINNHGTLSLNAVGPYVGNASQVADLRFDNAALNLTGTGTVLMSDSTNNRLFGGSLTAGGTIRALTGSTVRLDDNVNVAGGTLTTSGTGTTNVRAATITDLTNTGTIAVAGAGNTVLSTAGTTPTTARSTSPPPATSTTSTSVGLRRLPQRRPRRPGQLDRRPGVLRRHPRRHRQLQRRHDRRRGAALRAASGCSHPAPSGCRGRCACPSFPTAPRRSGVATFKQKYLYRSALR